MKKTLSLGIAVLIIGYLFSQAILRNYQSPPDTSYPVSQVFKTEVPSHYDKLLIYFHGAGETVNSIANDPQKRPIFDRLESQGYIVAYSRAHGLVWGNETSLNDYRQLYAYLTSKYKIKSTVFLGQSMGGIPSLELVSQGQIPVKCWAGIYPAINLDALYDLGNHPELSTIYPNKSGLTEHNPILMDNYHIPMRIYASPGDTSVPTSTGTQLFVDAHKNVSWVKTTGDHGDSSNFQTDDLVNFYNNCLEKS